MRGRKHRQLCVLLLLRTERHNKECSVYLYYMRDSQFINIPKTPEQVRETNWQALFGALGIAESKQDQKQVKKSVAEIRKIFEGLPAEMQHVHKNKAERNEFVMAVPEGETGDVLFQQFYDLGIFPWTEDGKLIVDKPRDLEKLRWAGLIFGVELTQPSEEVAAVGVDIDAKRYAYPLPPQAPVERRRQVRDQRLVQQKHEFSPGIDTELLGIVRKFDQGLIDEESEEFQSVIGGDMPTLTLFPQKYFWKNGRHVNQHTGEVITREKEQVLLTKAKSGDKRALDEFIRLNIGFVLYMAKRLQAKFGGDIDDLFQEGLMGLSRAIELHDPAKNERGVFVTYARYWIDQRMRRYQQVQGISINRPVHTSQKRREVYSLVQTEEKKQALQGDAYFDDPENRVYFEKLKKLEQRLLISARFEPVEDIFADESPVDVDMFARDLVKMPAQEEAVEAREIEERITKAFSTLTPREELVLRLRFGLVNMKEVVIPGMQPGERLGEAEDLDGLTFEEVGMFFGVTRERVRQIEAKALRKLKHPSRSRRLFPLVAITDEMEKDTATEVQERLRNAQLEEKNKERLERGGIDLSLFFKRIPQNWESWVNSSELQEISQIPKEDFTEELAYFIAMDPGGFYSHRKYTASDGEVQRIFNKEYMHLLMDGYQKKQVAVKEDWLQEVDIAEELGVSQERVHRYALLASSAYEFPIFRSYLSPELARVVKEGLAEELNKI